MIAILYGALAALSQTNLRRMLAFSSLSHVGLVLLGIASFNLQGIQGALFQLLNFTIVAGGIFLLAGFLHHRVGSTDMLSLGGVAHSMPLLAAFFFLFGLAGMGVPGTNGFPAEFLLILSALKTHTGAGLAALAGVILGAAYFLGIYRRAFLGPAHKAVIADAVDLRARELIVVSVMGILILVGGFYPNSDTGADACCERRLGQSPDFALARTVALRQAFSLSPAPAASAPQGYRGGYGNRVDG